MLLLLTAWKNSKEQAVCVVGKRGSTLHFDKAVTGCPFQLTFVAKKSLNL